MGAVVRRPLRRQAAGAPQRPYSHPEQNPLRGAAAREGRAAETAASRRLQGFRLPLQAHPRGLLSRRRRDAVSLRRKGSWPRMITGELPAYYISPSSRRGRTLFEPHDGFASAFSLIWELSPGALCQYCCPVGGAEEVGT